jgi:1-deoxy-D-xylulose-5-phosphate synthase
VRAGRDATILAYGVMTGNALAAADLLAVDDIHVSVINARFAKPVDRQMVRDALASGRPVVTVEDHSISGGFGSAVLEAAQEMGLDASSFTRLGLPDRFVEHGSRSGQLSEVGLDAVGIAAAVHALLERSGAELGSQRGVRAAGDADSVLTRS